MNTQSHVKYGPRVQRDFNIINWVEDIGISYATASEYFRVAYKMGITFTLIEIEYRMPEWLATMVVDRRFARDFNIMIFSLSLE